MKIVRGKEKRWRNREKRVQWRGLGGRERCGGIKGNGYNGDGSGLGWSVRSVENGRSHFNSQMFAIREISIWA